MPAVQRVRVKEQARILVVRLGAIGDVLRVLPAVRRLRVRRPDVSLAWAVEDWVYPLVADNPNIDRFHVLQRNALRGGPARVCAESRRFIGEVRACHYDVALDFHGRLKSGMVSWLSGARVRIGYAARDSTECNWLFSNVRVRLRDTAENRVLRFLHLLEPLGVDGAFDPTDTGIFVDEQARAAARGWYESCGRPPLAAYPGTSRNQAAYHRWPAEKWVELLGQLARAGISTAVFWGPDDAEYTRAIAAQAPGCVLAPATTLNEMLAALGLFDAFIGTNTAAMHMAWLQGVPTAVFTGPVHPRTDAPLDTVPSRVLQAGEHFRVGASKRRQPEVVGAVAVEEALDAVRFLLAAARDRPRRS